MLPFTHSFICSATHLHSVIPSTSQSSIHWVQLRGNDFSAYWKCSHLTAQRDGTRAAVCASTLIYMVVLVFLPPPPRCFSPVTANVRLRISPHSNVCSGVHFALVASRWIEKLNFATLKAPTFVYRRAAQLTNRTEFDDLVWHAPSFRKGLCFCVFSVSFILLFSIFAAA